jgi:hypothetical protein
MLTFAALILAIDQKISSLNLNSIKLRSNYAKKYVKREKLLGLWAIVRTLRHEENLSFREISRYFLKFHKFEISHSMVQKIWNELEKIGEKNEEK